MNTFFKGSNTEKNNSKEKKHKNHNNVVEFMTRIVVRHLPPTLTQEQFLEVVSPLPDYSEFYFVNGDLKLTDFSFSRAYLKFKNIDDLLLFKEKYDNYIFLDSKGNEYSAIIEYAPIQKLSRRFNSIKINKDIKMNTIENDSDFITFKELLNCNNETIPQISADQLLKEIENRNSKENETHSTPLIEYLKKKRLEKNKLKEEKKRKKEEVKKKKIYQLKEKSLKKCKELDEKKQENVNQKESDSKKIKSKEEPTIYVVKMIHKEEKSENKVEEQVKDKNSFKETNRLKNKDRPAREIYRPGMTRKNKQANFGEESVCQASTSKESSSFNKNKQQKYSNRVFTRSKN